MNNQLFKENDHNNRTEACVLRFVDGPVATSIHQYTHIIVKIWRMKSATVLFFLHL